MHNIVQRIKSIWSYIASVFVEAWKDTFSRSQNIINFIYIILWAVVSFLSKYIPNSPQSVLKTIMTMNWWMVSGWAFGTLLAVRILIAPYSIHKKDMQLLKISDEALISQKRETAKCAESSNKYELELMELRRTIRELRWTQLLGQQGG